MFKRLIIRIKKYHFLEPRDIYDFLNMLDYMVIQNKQLKGNSKDIITEFKFTSVHRIAFKESIFTLNARGVINGEVGNYQANLGPSVYLGF